jgi:hypothetical protein
MCTVSGYLIVYSGCRHGVLVGNWYENAENRAQAGDGQHLLGFAAPFQGVATTAAAQSIQVGLWILVA